MELHHRVVVSVLADPNDSIAVTRATVCALLVVTSPVFMCVGAYWMWLATTEPYASEGTGVVLTTMGASVIWGSSTLMLPPYVYVRVTATAPSGIVDWFIIGSMFVGGVLSICAPRFPMQSVWMVLAQDSVLMLGDRVVLHVALMSLWQIIANYNLNQLDDARGSIAWHIIGPDVAYHSGLIENLLYVIMATTVIGIFAVVLVMQIRHFAELLRCENATTTTGKQIVECLRNWDVVALRKSLRDYIDQPDADRTLHEHLRSIVDTLVDYAHFAPRPIMTALRERKIALTSRALERCAATVLHLEFVRYVDLCAAVPPAELAAMLSYIGQRVTHALVQHGATIVECAGPTIVAVWGAPTSHVHAATLACCAALHVLGVVQDDVSARYRQVVGPATGAPRSGVAVRMGVHRGSVVAGNIGPADEHGTYAVMGGVVQCAASLCRLGVAMRRSNVSSGSRSAGGDAALSPSEIVVSSDVLADTANDRRANGQIIVNFATRAMSGVRDKRCAFSGAAHQLIGIDAGGGDEQRMQDSLCSAACDVSASSDGGIPALIDTPRGASTVSYDSFSSVGSVGSVGLPTPRSAPRTPRQGAVSSKTPATAFVASVLERSQAYLRRRFQLDDSMSDALRQLNEAFALHASGQSWRAASVYAHVLMFDLCIMPGEMGVDRARKLHDCGLGEPPGENDDGDGDAQRQRNAQRQQAGPARTAGGDWGRLLESVGVDAQLVRTLQRQCAEPAVMRALHVDSTSDTLSVAATPRRPSAAR